MQTIYRPGHWHLLVMPGALVALPPDAPAEIVASLWERLPARKTLATVIDVLTTQAGSFTALPPFAAAVAEGSDVRIALRGGVSARVTAADGAHELDGAEVTTWSERFVGGATRVEITVEAVDGEVRLPVQTGVVQASAVSAELESADAAPLTGALGPAPVVAASADGISASVLSGAAVRLASFAGTEASTSLAAATASSAATGPDEDEQSNDSTSTPGDDSVTGAAGVRDESDADAAISAPLLGAVPVPPADADVADAPAVSDAAVSDESDATDETDETDATDESDAPDAAAASDAPDANDESDASDASGGSGASDASDVSGASDAPGTVASADDDAVPAAPASAPDAPTEQLDEVPVVAELVAPEVDGVTLIPTEATLAASDDDFDLLFGDTVHTAPPVPRISAPPAPPVPFPTQGDHDGSTISADELRAMRQQPASADETPTAVIPVADVPTASAGRIRVSSGQVVALDRTVIIGRRPRSTRASGANLPHLIAVESPQQDISRSHLEVRPEGDTVVVIDLHTTNGSTLLRPGADPVRLHPGEQTLVLTGDVVDLGDGITIAFEDLP
ncbi:FHA domain-containing protein [uncultured Microbacterium sp.]|uniref:FHA domain-containing protein n=1 Tax=uncultured Microbacterium sp. TaxID=191216 RepID=UPI0028DCEB88|nr:FHA domain-containing protein [uncultured Microbacterium sp.]